jgi:hypothetical protein
MGRKSKIEIHPQSEEIIKRLASGEKYSSILHKFHDLTRFDLDYYRENKLPKILSKSSELKLLAEQIESADIHKGDTYLQLVLGLQKKALDALDGQDPQRDAKSWSMISREARGYLELLGKALDRIKDAPQINVQVSIYQSPEWLVVGSLLARILAPYPEIRIEVAKELLALQEAHT